MCFYSTKKGHVAFSIFQLKRHFKLKHQLMKTEGKKMKGLYSTLFINEGG